MTAENPENGAAEQGFSFSDKRRIDPVTGEVRNRGQGENQAPAEPENRAEPENQAQPENQAEPEVATGGAPAPETEPQVTSPAGAGATADQPAADPAGPEADVPDDISGLADAAPAPAEGESAADAAATSDSQLAEERLADLQRINAEYAAYRMRAQREQDRAREAGTQTVIEALIPVLDEVKLAQENGDVTGPFEAHAKKLVGALDKVGVEQFGAPGEEFDPNIHEALMQQPSEDVEAPTVFMVMQPGYRIGDRVIRAARVGVQAPAE